MPDTHGCPGGCGQPVPRKHFACPGCWRRLPVELRREINASHRPGRFGGAHMHAMVAGRRWYIEHPLEGS
ncbi:MAG: hypothetical protein HYR62_02025 [Actinobacteria bacterium]|nr:hypothetical protein [Actinomycetota bacterium]MBI3687261.1 hypothetical protein [Actinomycetota bacterium]